MRSPSLYRLHYPAYRQAHQPLLESPFGQHQRVYLFTTPYNKRFRYSFLFPSTLYASFTILFTLSLGIGLQSYFLLQPWILLVSMIN